MYKSDKLKNKFFGFCLPMVYYFNLLPDVLDFKTEFNRRLYKHYGKFIYTFAIFITICLMIKLHQLLSDDMIIIEEAIRTLNITLYFCNVLIRSFFLKGKLSTKIFKKVFHFEDVIYSSGDSTVQSAYEASLILVRRVTYSYLIGMILLVASYIPAPFLRDPYYITKGNETSVMYQTPLSQWTPFKNYWVVYVYTASCGSFVSYMFTATDLMCYCFILFGVTQMDVLHHYINNFQKYASEHSTAHRTTLEDSYRKLQKENVKKHQDIISYVNELNDTLKHIMLADFLPSSVQLASVIFQIMKSLNVAQVVLIGQFIVTQMGRIFVYCSISNILTQKGLEIADAWYNLDWTEFPEDVRKDIILCIMRPQKPLYISIGKFHDITLETFLAILRGTYSYTLLLTTI